MNKLSLAKYFAGRTENIAYSKIKQGGLNVRNDGALSKQELSTAINSGKLSANERNVALYFSKHFTSFDQKTVQSGVTPNGSKWKKTLAPDLKLSHKEVVDALSQRKQDIGLQKAINALQGIVNSLA